MLRREVTWRSSVLITLGAALLVTVSLGPMTEELGTASALVWLLTAIVGALQCLLLAQLARLMPGRAGGTATYAHAAFGGRAPLVAAASSWGYWLAWTPGIAVNLILAATYLRETVWHGASTFALAVSLGAGLYALNALGLRMSMRLAAVAAGVAVVTLIVLVGGAVMQPSLIDIDRLLPLAVTDHSWTAAATWLLVLKWTFVAAWAAYGAEMASTIVAEMRNPVEKAPRAMHTAGAIGLVAFGLLPALMIALVGVGHLTEEPLVAFLPVARSVVGSTGETVLGVMLFAALVLGAQAFIVGSSRTIYQMTRDGYMPRQFARVNSRGVPIGSVLCDAVVILAFLAVFGTNVVDVVAAANVGYLVVFVLLPVAYIAIRARLAATDPFALSRALVAPAAFLAAFNAVLLVVGGSQWGGSVLGVGVAAMTLIVPIALLRRAQDRREGRKGLLAFPAGEPHDRVDADRIGEWSTARPVAG